jgi:hypothetical protein
MTLILKPNSKPHHRGHKGKTEDTENNIKTLKLRGKEDAEVSRRKVKSKTRTRIHQERPYRRFTLMTLILKANSKPHHRGH